MFQFRPRTRSRLLRATLGATLSLVLASSSGCLSMPVVARRDDSAPRGTVTNATVLWSEAVLRDNGVPVAQGFASKVYLFGPSNAHPVASPGTFTIYAFDDTDRAAGDADSSDVKPTRTWTFQESELRSRMMKDALGWSYPLWLPYGPLAGTERRVSLRLCFTPEGGRPVLSESALVTLPAAGSKGSATLADKSSKSAAAISANKPNLAYRPLDEAR